MRYASVAELKNRLSEFLNRARRRNEPIVVTRHGKPFALIQAISEADLESLDWGRLTKAKLLRSWEGEPEALYDYL